MLHLLVASLILVLQTSPTTMPSDPPQSDQMPPADFGSPPGGTIPILYNDHHVYASPDRLTHGRVLAALVRGSTILIPLRSMFEQMGATVSYDAGSRTVHVTKPGSDITVTVGVPQVTINGEQRPLDVPPELHHGVVMVPVRVISESMGAYVQWVADRQIVVVRYIVATPPPPPAPAPPPATAPPTPTPTPTPKPKPKHQIWAAGDYIVEGNSYDEFSAGQQQFSSWAARGGAEFTVGIPMMVAVNWQQYRYPHLNFGAPCPGDPGCVTTVGNFGQTNVHAFTVREDYSDARLGFKVSQPRIYLDVGWLYNIGNQGYPKLTGWEFGAEKVPDFDQEISWYGGYWYAPNVRGEYTGFGQSLPMRYEIQTYDFGLTWRFTKQFPLYFDAGYLGNAGAARLAAPAPGFSHSGPYAGLGISFTY